ncbi:MAG: GTPase ObgE [Dehalococcoidales bacterium]|nr:GTPase ObgE [Dehalococcoidales bacterium]
MYDKVEVIVKGGNGGDGAISFLREKFIPKGGPDGGDGGDGGNVVFRADNSVSSLREYRGRRSYRGADGGKGQDRKKHGRNGLDKVLMVPPGTIISAVADDGSEELLADLDQVGQKAIVAHGGAGGLGNIHYVSSVHQAPMIAQSGAAGEEKTIHLEMRLIADVGIIGYPNVGKSSLLAAASAAKPKIASYPFTTLEPMLGVVEVGLKTFVMADIPGLIEGAHLGRGLGHDFLRHIMRTRVLIHLVDAAAANPVEDMKLVNNELALFDPALARKFQLVAVNKIDLPEVAERIETIRDDFHRLGIEPFFISAATKQGVPELMAAALALVEKVTAEQKEAAPALKVFHPEPRRKKFAVSRDGKNFVVSVPDLERLTTKDGMVTQELRWHLKRQFDRRGISKELEKAGIKPGDKVRCGSLEWDW